MSWAVIFVARLCGFWLNWAAMNVFNRFVFVYTVNWSLRICLKIWKNDFCLPVLCSSSTCLWAFFPLAYFPVWTFIGVTLFDFVWFFIIWAFWTTDFFIADLTLNFTPSFPARTAFWTVTPFPGYPHRVFFNFDTFLLVTLRNSFRFFCFITFRIGQSEITETTMYVTGLGPAATRFAASRPFVNDPYRFSFS